MPRILDGWGIPKEPPKPEPEPEKPAPSTGEEKNYDSAYDNNAEYDQYDFWTP